METLEKPERSNSELIFELNTTNKIKNQRSILAHYLKIEAQKIRKQNKSDILSIQNVKGLLTILNIFLDGFSFLNHQNLFSNMTVLLQSMKIHTLQMYETIELMDNEQSVLFKGTICKCRQAVTTKPSSHFLSLLLEDCKTKNQQKKSFGKNGRNPLVRRSILKKKQSTSKKNSSTMRNQGLHARYSPFKNQSQNFNAPDFKSRNSSESGVSCSVQETQSPILLDSKIKGIGLMQQILTFEAVEENTVLFTFPKSSIEKFLFYFNQEIRQNISKFLSEGLGIDSMRLIGKLLPKIQKIELPSKYQTTIDNKKLMFLYKGEIMLNNGYQIQLRGNSVLWPKPKEKYHITVIEDQSVCIFIEAHYLHQYLHEVYPQVLAEIRERLDLSIEKRQSFFETAIPQKFTKIRTRQSEQNSVQFFSEHATLNPNKNSIRPMTCKRQKPLISQTNYQEISDQKLSKQQTCTIKLVGNQFSMINFGHDYTQRKNNTLNSPKINQQQQKKAADDCHQQRFRVMKSEQKKGELYNKLYYQPENKPFMSLYPFYKILESSEKIQQRKKEFYRSKQSIASNKENVFQQPELIQRERKERKRIFYNEKVRKMKIKNIACREIPNGHRREFNVVGAEQQIAKNSLISPIIEYPMQGFNQEKAEGISVTKKSMKNLREHKEKTVHQGSKQQNKSPVFRKTDVTMIHKIQDSNWQNQFGIGSFSKSKKIEERLTSSSNLKRTTLDVSDHSFHQRDCDFFVVGKFSKQKRSRKSLKRPITEHQKKEKQKELKKFGQSFLQCERIKTQV